LLADIIIPCGIFLAILTLLFRTFPGIVLSLFGTFLGIVLSLFGTFLVLVINLFGTFLGIVVGRFGTSFARFLSNDTHYSGIALVESIIPISNKFPSDPKRLLVACQVTVSALQ